MEKLSVIVTIYNTENYLEQCVNSILNQLFCNLEIILVDDGSTDDSGKISDQLEKKDMRIVVIHKENGGTLSARAAGVEMATGDYITFVDSDDWIEANMYENLMSKLLEYDADWITSGCYRYYREDYVRESYDRSIPEGFYDKKSMVEKIYPIMMYDEAMEINALDPSTCFKIYKKELLWPILKELKDKHFHFGEDQAISYLYALKANSMICTYDKYYYHRQRNIENVPSYFMDDKFYSKMLEFYDFMISETQDGPYSEIMKKQIDLFYVIGVRSKKLKYNYLTADRSWYYLFPYDDVKDGERVIIYGAGAIGNDYKKQLAALKKWQLVDWVDRNYSSVQGVSNPATIFTSTYDYIVIAILDEKISNSVIDWLVSNGVNKNKIVHRIIKVVM